MKDRDVYDYALEKEKNALKRIIYRINYFMNMESIVAFGMNLAKVF